MVDLARRLAALSPEKRRLLARRNPLSFVQQRLWFLDRLHGHSRSYNGTLALELRGALDVPALCRTLGEIVRRQQVLRTAIVEVEGQPLQLVVAEVAVHLPALDLRELAAGEQEVLCRRLAAAEMVRPLDLGQVPQLRSVLLRLGPARHVLLLSLHHIVTDRWSLAVLVREAAAIYPAFAAGRPSPLPELPLQFLDYALHQRRQLQGERLQQQLSYWRGYLEGAPDQLELPADRPRPANPGFFGSRLELPLGLELSRGVASLCQRQGVTEFMVLMAAWHALLFRYTDQRDLVVGYGVSGRPRVELEDVIGCFVDTLVLRSRPAPGLSFADLLAAVERDTLAGREHGDLPFERLIEELRPERALSHNPLFQVSFALQNAPREHLRLPGLEVAPLDLRRETVMFDFTLVIEQEEDGDRTLAALYSSELFDATTAARMLRHLRRLVAGALEAPACPLAQLPILGRAERQQVLLEWNDTAWAAGPCAESITEMFRAQAACTPETIAVLLDESGRKHHLSYRLLDERSDQLADQLRGLGVGPEVLVGLCLERCLALPVVLLAVLKAGGAYLPLDPDYPAERLEYMLRDAGASLLLVARGLAASGGFDAARAAAEAGCRLGWLRTTDASLEREVPTPCPPEPAATRGQQLAYVIYTSGSTGRPKGAMIARASLVNHMRWKLRDFPLAAGSRVLHKAPFSFDASVWELYWPLLAAGTVVLARPGGQRDPAYLAGLLREEQVQVVHFVPPMLRTFLSIPAAGGCRSLRWVMCGGEALPPELARRARERLPAMLVSFYGPTETTIQVSSHRCRRRAGASRAPTPRRRS